MALTKGVKVCTFENDAVDAKAGGAVLIGTTPNNGMAFHPQSVTVRTVSGSNVLTVATLSLGTNSTSYNNILGSTILAGSGTVGKLLNLVSGLTMLDYVPPNTPMYANVTPILGTSQVLDIAIHGFYSSLP